MGIPGRFLALYAMSIAFSSSAASAATIEVAVSNFRFTPNDVTINVGDTVRWTNTGGLHNVSADDGSFGNDPASNNWTFTRTFTSVGDVRYFCEVHSAPGTDINIGMNGIVRVQGAPEPPPFAINQGIGGTWVNPATSGSGILIDLLTTPKFMFAAWFTYEKALPAPPKVGNAQQRWMTASGAWSGNTATLTLFSSTGGIFDNGAPVTTTAVGTLNLSFTDCRNGSATYTIPGENLSNTFPINRQGTSMATLCQSLIPAPAAADGK